MERLTASAEASATREAACDQETVFRCLHRAAYTVGEARVICWLCKNDHPSPEKGDEAFFSSKPVFLAYTVGIYSAQSGLLCVDFSSLETAREVFMLLIRFGISPYHVEDVLEDRDISARIRYL